MYQKENTTMANSTMLLIIVAAGVAYWYFYIRTPDAAAASAATTTNPAGTTPVASGTAAAAPPAVVDPCAAGGCVDFPQCKPGCVEAGGNQKDGVMYRIQKYDQTDKKCLIAQGGCNGCLESYERQHLNGRYFPQDDQELNSFSKSCSTQRDTRK